MLNTKFNDNYCPNTTDLLNDGCKWEYAEEFYHVLQNRRKQFGMTQQQVANAANIELRQYQKFESGERSMSGASMRIGLSICSVLKLDPYRFCF